MSGKKSPTPQIPFVHFTTALSPHVTPSEIYHNYLNLLAKTKHALSDVGAGTDYNLILVPEWMTLIPRTCKGRGQLIANAANMVGLMWTRSEEVRDEIVEMGVEGLARLGIPIHTQDRPEGEE